MNTRLSMEMIGYSQEVGLFMSISSMFGNVIASYLPMGSMGLVDLPTFTYIYHTNQSNV